MDRPQESFLEDGDLTEDYSEIVDLLEERQQAKVALIGPKQRYDDLNERAVAEIKAAGLPPGQYRFGSHVVTIREVAEAPVSFVRRAAVQVRIVAAKGDE